MKKENKKKYSNDSIDNVVDRYLIEYEKVSLISKNENFDIKKFIFSELLIEAEKEKKASKDKKEKDNDALIGKTDFKLDVNEFMEKVVRLAENYDNLINMRDLILSRAVNFVQENHGKSIAIQFEKELRNNFDIEINRSKVDKDFDFKAPYSIRSGGGAT